MYVYTEDQDQGQHLNTDKHIEVITNNELHCMLGNTLNKIKFGRQKLYVRILVS